MSRWPEVLLHVHLFLPQGIVSPSCGWQSLAQCWNAQAHSAVVPIIPECVNRLGKKLVSFLRNCIVSTVPKQSLTGLAQVDPVRFLNPRYRFAVLLPCPAEAHQNP